MRNQISIRALTVAAVFVLCSCAGHYVEQSDWRAPSGNEANDEWRTDATEKNLVAKGDFNGDGILDTAKLLIRKDGLAFGLFVFLSQGNATVKPYLLNEDNDVRHLHGMGIEKVSPGVYKTACGKGYWECKPKEEPEVSIPYDAVNYFKVESANSYYYWDKQHSNFIRIWISD